MIGIPNMLDMILLDTEKLPHQQALDLQCMLGKYGSLTCYETTGVAQVIDRCIDKQIIIVNKNILSREHFYGLPNLKYVIVIATGYDNVDVAAAKECGVAVSNVPDYSTLTVAQHAIALLLELTNQVGYVGQIVKQGKWHSAGHKHTELAGLTMGVFGFGNIAKQVVKIAQALGMKVLVCSRDGSDAVYSTDLKVQFVDKDDIFRHSDVISLHCPINESTKNLINKKSLEIMKPNCLLINTARGGLVNEDDLYEALANKQIKAAALDVVNCEPILPSNPLLTLNNCIFSPHNAWISKNSLEKWLNIIEYNLVGYIHNELVNLV